MKKIIILNFMLVCLITTCCGQVKTDEKSETKKTSTDLVIKNVSVIPMTTDTILSNQDVVIRDGKILSIKKSKNKTYKNIKVVDGSGKYIMPSLSDAHVHLPKEEEELEKFFILNLINGVTKVRSMRGKWEHLQWRDKYNTDTSIYPKMYLSAPPIYRNYDLSDEELAKYTNDAKDFDFIKILSIKDKRMFKSLDSLSKKNNIPLAGHFPSNIPDELIFDSNYTSFEHLGGLAVEEDLLESRLQAIKKRNMYICPTLSWYDIGSGKFSYEELRQLPGIEFISSSTVEEWISKTKAYREKLGQEAYVEEVKNEMAKLDKKYEVISRLNELGVKMLLSPDSSSKYMVSGFNMLGEMKLLIKANLSNFKILEMATKNFADFFNEDYGVIKVNQMADFILLDGNPLENLDSLKKIEGIYFNRIYLNNNDLKKLSESVMPK